jgi:hypothetical protein
MLNYPVGQLSLTSPAVISSGVLLLVAILIKIFTSNRSRLNLPIATGKIKNGSFEDMLIEAQALVSSQSMAEDPFTDKGSSTLMNLLFFPLHPHMLSYQTQWSMK